MHLSNPNRYHFLQLLRAHSPPSPQVTQYTHTHPFKYTSYSIMVISLLCHHLNAHFSKRGNILGLHFL